MSTARTLKRSASEYHSDPCVAPSFSASIGKIIFDQSPMHAYLEHPRLGGKGKERTTTPAMEFGTAVHSLILGGQSIKTIAADGWITKAARAERDIARAEGYLPMLEKDFARAQDLVNAFHRQQYETDKAERFIYLDSQREVMIESEHANKFGEGTENRVFARSMLDVIQVDSAAGRIHIRDIKTTADCSERGIQRAITDKYYAMQLACYEWQAACLYPEYANRIDSRLWFIETEPPFSLVTVELDDAFRKIGRNQLCRAWDTWQQCIATGVWPSFTLSAPLLIGPPTWLEKEELDTL